MAETVVRTLVTKWLVKSDTKGIKDLNKELANSMKLLAATAAAFTAVVLPAAKLQEAIRTTMTLTDQAGSKILKLEKDLTNSAIKLSNKFAISSAKVADGFYQSRSTGARFLSERFNELSKTSLQMSQVVGMSMYDAVEGLNDTLNSFGLESNEFDRVADTLFTTSKLAATTVPQLVVAMKQTAPAARTAGIGIEKASAILATFANRGIKAADAGMAFKQIFVRMLTGKNLKMLEKLRVGGKKVSPYDEFGEVRNVMEVLKDVKKATSKMNARKRLQIYRDIAGQFPFSRFAALMGSNLDQMVDYEKALERSGGALDKAFNIKMASASMQLQLFWVRIKNVAAQIGEPMLAPLTKMITAVSEVVENISDWIMVNEELAESFALFGGSLMVLLAITAVIGALITSFGLLKSAGIGAWMAMLWPIMLVIGALMAVWALYDDISSSVTDPSSDSFITAFLSPHKDDNKLQKSARAFFAQQLHSMQTGSSESQRAAIMEKDTSLKKQYKEDIVGKTNKEKSKLLRDLNSDLKENRALMQRIKDQWGQTIKDNVERKKLYDSQSGERTPMPSVLDEPLEVLRRGAIAPFNFGFDVGSSMSEGIGWMAGRVDKNYNDFNARSNNVKLIYQIKTKTPAETETIKQVLIRQRRDSSFADHLNPAVFGSYPTILDRSQVLELDPGSDVE